MHPHVVIAILVLAFGLSANKASGNNLAQTRLLKASELRDHHNEQGETSSSTKFIPYIAQGGGWGTEFYAFNLCSSPVEYSVWFYDADGELEEFLFLSDGEHYAGFQGSLQPGVAHVQFLPDREGGVQAGYGWMADDGGGCVALDTVYWQRLPDGRFRQATIPVQHLSTPGVAFPFINLGDCDTGVAVISPNGKSVSLEAMALNGDTLGQADLGNIYHRSFMLSDLLPVQDQWGTLRVNGEVSAVGLEFCQAELAQFRLAHPIPEGPNNPWAVVSIETKLVAECDPGRVCFYDARYSVKLTLRNPTQVDHTYNAIVEFKDSDGFLLGSNEFDSWHLTDLPGDVHNLFVPAGQERLFLGTVHVFLDGGVSDVASVGVEISLAD